MKKHVLLLTALFAVLFAFCAIPAFAKTLQIVSPWEVKSPDPIISGFIFSRVGITEKLFTAGQNGQVIGQLAKSWSVSEDKLTWSFELRPGVKFHDGTELNAETAVKSLKHAFENKGVLSKTPITKIIAAGPMTVQIATTEPFATLPAYLSHSSSSIVSAASFADDGKINKLIGTGYYQVKKFEGNNLLELTAFSDYWGDRPFIPEVTFNAVTKVETRGMMMRAGQAQLGYVFTPMDAEKLGQDSNFKVQRLSLPRVDILKLNCKSPFFDDVRVRRAISLAIDRKSIAKAILRNEDQAATQLLPPAIKSWFNESLEPLTFDVEKSKKLLDETGWTAGSDGVRQKDGKTFKVTLNTYPARPMLPTVATAIQAQLKKVGIQVDIAIGDWTIIPEKHKDGTMEMSLFSRNFGLLPDAVGTIAVDYTNGGAPWGAMGWQSARLDQIVSDYTRTFDPEEAAQGRKEIVAIMQSELPVLPITWTQKVIINHKSLSFVPADPFEMTYYLDKMKWAE